MWDVLKDYPAARVRLEAVAVKRLEKYKKAPLEKGLYHHATYHYQIIVNYKSISEGEGGKSTSWFVKYL